VFGQIWVIDFDPRIVDPGLGLSYPCLSWAGTVSFSAFRPLFAKLLSRIESANERRCCFLGFRAEKIL